MRKQLDELKRQQEEEASRQDGEEREGEEPKQPRDPEQRETGQPEEAGAGGNAPDAAPAWLVNLPPQIRDAWVRGDFDKIPPEYRELIERYLIWLNRAAREEGPSGSR